MRESEEGMLNIRSRIAVFACLCQLNLSLKAPLEHAKFTVCNMNL